MRCTSSRVHKIGTPAVLVLRETVLIFDNMLRAATDPRFMGGGLDTAT